MRLNASKFLTMSALLLSVGCATNQKGHELMRTATKSKDFDKAVEIIKSDEFFKDDKTKLLKHMEKALVYHLKGDYYQAMKQFDISKEISDKLFTVSMSKKAGALLSSDTNDNYYGEDFERSMLRYYQALNHYMLHLNGKYEAHKIEELDKEGKIIATKEIAAKVLNNQEKRFHLTAAKNTMIEWNSLLETYKAETAGKAVYKDDLLAKIFGAFIHEQMGSNDDRNIALNLYKEAKNVLFRNYSMLPTYNKKHKEFAKNFSKFPLMNEEDVIANYVSKTEHYVGLEKFINDQINRLSNNKNSKTVFVLIENDFISPKVSKKFDFPIPVGTAPASVDNSGNFMNFTAQILKTAEDMKPKIYFEMPEIPYAPPIIGQSVVLKDEKGNVVAQKSLSTVNPLTEVANYTLEDRSISEYAKVGARVVGKHVAALVASYEVYKKQPNAMGTMLASGAYALANKGIEASERADLRSWSLLPHMFSSTAIEVKPGRYIAEYHREGIVENLGTVEVTNESNNSLVHRRIFK